MNRDMENELKPHTSSVISKICGRIALAVFLGILVLFIASGATMSLKEISLKWFFNIWILNGVNLLVGIFLSFILILTISRTKLSKYGFNLTQNLKPRISILLGLGLGILATVSGALFGIDEPPMTSLYTFTQQVIFIWIGASINEEILVRGLVQSFLDPLKIYGFHLFKIRVSLPVMVSAVFFGLMHLVLLTVGMGFMSVLYIVVYAFILGIFAAYLREQSDSLIPAILIHMCANIGGSIAGLII